MAKVLLWFLVMWRRLRGKWMIVYPGGAAIVKSKDLTAALAELEFVSQMVHGADGVRNKLDYREQVAYCTPWSHPYPTREEMH